MPKAKASFYAVHRGRQTGVFRSWDECKAQVDKFSGAVFKGFPSRAEAEEFVRHGRTGAPKMGAADGPHDVEESRPPPPPPPRIELPDLAEMQRKFDARITKLKPVTVSPVMDQQPQSPRPPPSPAANETANEGLSPSLSSSHRKRPRSRSRSRSRSPAPTLGIVRVYTDGSCLGNGRKGGLAGIGAYFGNGDKRNVSEPLHLLDPSDEPSNQKAEIQAITEALKRIPPAQPVEILTDSKYVIGAMNSVNGWIFRWRRIGFDQVKNAEYFRALDAELTKRTGEIKWTYVPGHKGIEGNEMADYLARMGAARFSRSA